MTMLRRAVPNQYFWLPTGRSIANSLPVLELHGHTGSEAQWFPAIFGSELQTYMCRLGAFGYSFPMASTWGNGDAMTAVNQAHSSWTWMSGGKTILVGYSMGGLAALNYAERNPEKIAAIALVAPVTRLGWLYNQGTHTESIDAAYGGNFAANGTDRDPENFTAVDDLPVFIQHGNDDALIGDVEGWATSHNAEITVVPNAHHTSVWRMMDHEAFAQQVMDGAQW